MSIVKREWRKWFTILLVLSLVLPFLQLVFPQPVQAAYANGYTYRRLIDITDAQVSSGPHTNFPMLFSVTLADLKTTGNGGKVTDAQGDDIIFTASDGTTQLSHEVEKYDATTGELVAWVRVPSLAATSTIYIYYGNSSVTTFQGSVPGSVWDSDYKGVWHLKESSTGAANEFKDSTSNANHANGGVTLIQSTTASSTTPSKTISATFGSTPTQNNLLIAVAGTTTSTYVDGPSGWTKATATDNGNPSGGIYYKVAGASESSTVTFSFNSSSTTNKLLHIYEYSGLATSSAKDQTASGAKSGSDVQTGTTAITTQPSELLIAAAFAKHSSSGTLTASSWSDSFTEHNENQITDTITLATADRLVSARSTYSSAATFTGTGAFDAGLGIIATFKRRGEAPTQTASGKINGANIFNGSSNYIDVPYAANLAITGNITVETWVNIASVAANWNYIGYHGGKYEFGVYNTAKPEFKPRNDSGTYFDVTASSAISTGSWHHIAGVVSGANVIVYVDGVSVKSIATFSGSLRETGGGLVIGGAAAENWLNGTIDEYRVSSTARSDGWIATEYNNQNSPSAFYSVGSEEPAPANISNTPTSYAFGTLATGATVATGLTYFTVTNNSGYAINITIIATDMTGGTTWTLSDTATPGSNIYGLKAGLEGGSYNIVVQKSSATTLKSGLATSATQKWGLQLLAPTSFSDAGSKSGTVTLTATQA